MKEREDDSILEIEEDDFDNEAKKTTESKAKKLADLANLLAVKDEVEDEEDKIENEESSFVIEEEEGNLPDYVPEELINSLAEECAVLSEVFPNTTLDERIREMKNYFRDLLSEYRDKTEDFVIEGDEDRIHSKIQLCPNQKDVTLSLISDKDTIETLWELLDSYDTLLKDIQSEGQQLTANQKIVLQLLRNNIQIIKSKNYMDDVLGFSDYYRTSISTTKLLPSAFFQNETNKNEFASDFNKFEEAIDKTSLLDPYINTQNFYINKYLPDKKMREEGIKSGHIMTYNQDYREYLTSQLKYLEKNQRISSIDKMDLNKANVTNEEYYNLFTGEKSYVSERANDIEFELHLMDRGWPAVDMPLLRDLKNASEFIDKQLKSGDLNDTQAKKFLSAKNSFDKVTKKIFNTYVTSKELRTELLTEEIEPLLVPYNNLIKETFYEDVDFENVPLMRSYYDSAAKNINAIEAGTNPLTIHKDGITKETSLNGLSLEEIQNNLEIMIRDLKKVDPKTLRSSDEFSDMKTSLINLLRDIKTRNAEKGDLIKDPDDEISYKSMMQEFAPRIKETHNLVKRYLDYKNDQFQENKTRRNSSIRQYREQPRVKMAIGLYDKLGYMAERAEYFNDMTSGKKDPNDIKKEYIKSSTTRINNKNSYIGNLTSRQNTLKAEQKRDELKAKNAEVKAKDHPKAKNPAPKK